MELIQQVCTLDQAKRLKELGVNKPSLFIWWDFNGVSDPFFHNPPIINYGTNCTAFGSIQSELNECGYPAYTVAELGEMLPSYLTSSEDGVRGYIHSINVLGDGWECYYKRNDMGVAMHSIQEGKTEAQARAAMLIYLLEKNLIQP